MAKNKKSNSEDPEVVEGSDTPGGQELGQAAVEESAAPAPEAAGDSTELSQEEIDRRNADIWKSRMLHIRDSQIRDAARQFPAVAELVAENASLKAELAKK